MQFIVILGCIVMVTLAFIINKSKLFSPIKLFFCLWTLIMVLSCIHVTKLNVPSNEAYILILLMLESFLLGNVICIFIKNNKKSKTEYNNGHILYKKLFYIICAMVILLNIIDAIIVFKHLLNGVPMWKIRNWILEPFNSNNPILSRRTFMESFVRNVLFEPVGLLIHPVAAYHLFFEKNKKDKKIMLFLSILTVLTESLAGGGGRLKYIYFAACYFLAFLAFKKEINKLDILKKYRKIMIIFAISALIFVIGFTTLRSGGRSFANETYRYFAMPPTLLSEWLPEIKTEPHTCGLLTTFGIHSYFFRGLNQVGLISLVPNIFNNSFNNILNAEKFINVGSGHANAFVTPVYYFYIDGGFIFVIVASLFFGFLVTRVFNKIDKKLDVRNFMIYMVIMYGVFVSFMRIQTAIPSYIISIIFIYTLTKKDLGEQHEEK